MNSKLRIEYSSGFFSRIVQVQYVKVKCRKSLAGRERLRMSKNHYILQRSNQHKVIPVYCFVGILIAEDLFDLRRLSPLYFLDLR